MAWERSLEVVRRLPFESRLPTSSEWYRTPKVLLRRCSLASALSIKAKKLGMKSRKKNVKQASLPDQNCSHRSSEQRHSVVLALRPPTPSQRSYNDRVYPKESVC